MQHQKHAQVLPQSYTLHFKSFLNLVQLFHFSLAKIKFYLVLKVLLYPLHYLSARGKECDHRVFFFVG